MPKPYQGPWKAWGKPCEEAWPGSLEALGKLCEGAWKVASPAQDFGKLGKALPRTMGTSCQQPCKACGHLAKELSKPEEPLLGTLESSEKPGLEPWKPCHGASKTGGNKLGDALAGSCAGLRKPCQDLGSSGEAWEALREQVLQGCCKPCKISQSTWHCNLVNLA